MSGAEQCHSITAGEKEFGTFPISLNLNLLGLNFHSSAENLPVLGAIEVHYSHPLSLPYKVSTWLLPIMGPHFTQPQTGPDLLALLATAICMVIPSSSYLQNEAMLEKI